MRLGGRLQAAIDVLDDILERRTPANMALRDWGKAHRFAGSKDRSAIGNFVHDALRQKSSIGFRMDNEASRALILGSAVFAGGYDLGVVEQALTDDKHAPKQLSTTERHNLLGAINFDGAPEWVKGDVPEWLWPAFENNFGDEAVDEARALTMRPPLDIRVNALKTDLQSVFRQLENDGAIPCDISPTGLRFPAVSGDRRHPNLQIEEIFQTGGIEIQDEGSQLVSLLVDAKPGETILDFCAGGGGKSLAMAADMKNDGQLYAFDIDKRRLAPLYQRAHRAGATVINVCQPPLGGLSGLVGKMDRVLIDAPCSGVGTWRRKPDAKWRLSEDALERRRKEQKTVLDQARHYLRSGGLMFYVTCSMLAEENEAQVYEFLEDNADFSLLSAGEVFEEKFGTKAPKPWSEDGCTLTLTPASTATDGFFFAVMEKAQ